MRVALMMPALNEEMALPLVLADLERLKSRASRPVLDPIIVVDNGSTDRTSEIARQSGAVVLHESRRGYGAACLCAIDFLRARPPDILVFMDADHSDDATDVDALLEPILTGGYDLVIGSRTLGQHEPGALMPQARFGNWLATGLIRWRHGFRYSDLGPFRAVRFSALERMRMSDRDYGWTVEMQVRALQLGLRVQEIPVRYRKRVGQSKVSGTLSGSARAGVKILSTLWRLRAVRSTMAILAAVALGAGALAASEPARQPVDTGHAIWDRLLHTYVDDAGLVAYLDLQHKDADAFDAYLRHLADTDPDAWPRAEQLAFWINAYNAGTIAAILSGQSAESLIGRGKLFKFWKFPVAGKERSLDNIEHDILRKKFDEPRIHFAIVCASASCPALAAEAFVADRIDAQLDAQARRFINDPTRNIIDPAHELRLSKIFDWFRSDFERQTPLVVFLATYADDPGAQEWLRGGAKTAPLDFLDYNWSLNAQPEQRPRQAKPRTKPGAN